MLLSTGMNPVNELVRVNKVYESNNYDLIKIYENNRFSGQGSEIIDGQEIDFQKRLKKVKSILEKDGFNKHLPILCGYIDGVLTSYEGNTRLIACRELNINFFYEVDESLSNIKDFENACFALNNTGTKWNSKEKIAHMVNNPNMSIEDQNFGKELVRLSNKYKIAISNVLYIATNGCGHKTESLANKGYKMYSDTEQIIIIAKTIAENSVEGLSLFRNDRFLGSVMRAIRATNANNREAIINNLLTRTRYITNQKSSRKNWNFEIQFYANYNLKSCKMKINIL